MESKTIEVEGTLLEQKFIVPNERNPVFVGQETFLKNLHVLLSTSAPHKHNHRVAVFGLGGIGKTQSYWSTLTDTGRITNGCTG